MTEDSERFPEAKSLSRPPTLGDAVVGKWREPGGLRGADGVDCADADPTLSTGLGRAGRPDQEPGGVVVTDEESTDPTAAPDGPIGNFSDFIFRRISSAAVKGAAATGAPPVTAAAAGLPPPPPPPPPPRPLTGAAVPDVAMVAELQLGSDEPATRHLHSN